MQLLQHWCDVVVFIGALLAWLHCSGHAVTELSATTVFYVMSLECPWVRSSKYVGNHDNAVSRIPYSSCNTVSKCSWSILPSALDRSSMTNNIARFLSSSQKCQAENEVELFLYSYMPIGILHTTHSK